MIRSGIVAEKDRDKMVDTVFINIKKNSLDKNQLMILDMLANFDWKRPIYMTQVYILQDFGLMDYLQFDGYAYRLVPILTPTQNPYEIGRIDADYAAPLLRDTFRYGNLEDPRVYADYFIQYNLSASHARDAFARVAKELLRQDLAAGQLYVLEDGGGVYAVFAFIIGDDPTYQVIDGARLDDATPYGTLHRLGSDGTHTGVLAEAVAWAWARCPHLRADTHEDNHPMRRCLERAGFAYTGIIRVADGTPRRAYERI